jgi:hypothetical protein
VRRKVIVAAAIFDGIFGKKAQPNLSSSRNCLPNQNEKPGGSSSGKQI